MKRSAKIKNSIGFMDRSVAFPVPFRDFIYEMERKSKT